MTGCWCQPLRSRVQSVLLGRVCHSPSSSFAASVVVVLTYITVLRRTWAPYLALWDWCCDGVIVAATAQSHAVGVGVPQSVLLVCGLCRCCTDVYHSAAQGLCAVLGPLGLVL